MGVLAADALANEASGSNIETLGRPCSGADTFYRGAVVYLDAATCTVQVVPASGDIILGICTKTQTTTAANELVEVVTAGAVWLPLGTGVAADNAGDLVCQDITATQSDNPADFIPLDDLTPAAGDTAIGPLLGLTATQMLVRITPQNYVATIGWVG